MIAQPSAYSTMDVLEQSSAWLEDQRDRYMTRTVTYERGSESIELPATIGRTIFQIDDGAGALLRIESRDYLINTAELVLGGSVVLPKRGDRIREFQGTQVFIYEVVAPGQEPAWRYSDPYRRTLRIHTNQIDKETLP